MRKHFPDKVDPWLMVEREQVIRGQIPLSSMGRLLALSDDRKQMGDASFRLSFDRDQSRRAVVRCEIEAGLNLTCQRCLESMKLHLAIDSRLGLVRGLDESAKLPEELDPLMVAYDALLDIRVLVEDEILLAIPDVPKHAKNDCPLDLGALADDQESEDTNTGSNPFDILAVLKDGDRT